MFFYPSFFFAFKKKKCHNMLALMFDPRSKSMHLVTMFLGCENITIIIVKYDENLLLPLLMEANKLLMLDRVEKNLIFIHKWILKVYFILQQQQH